jgi:L-ascorbate metabolism protein UlaG (beta-lactamase superfamily)
MQKLTTAGNATIIAYDNSPILATDPWIGDEDSAYFGSWILNHKIPQELKKNISECKYIWFSHGHPDHLNSISLERYKGNKILLPDHVGARIFNDLNNLGFNVEILPDRKWVTLSKNIKIQCITTFIQDAVLLIDICGKLFINLNDSGARSCARYIRKITKNYKNSYVLGLSGYGDADMINIYDEQDRIILPYAATKPQVGTQLNYMAKITGANNVIPFSSFHQYQRTDSIWAQEYSTPLEAYKIGIDEDLNFIEPFCTIDCNSLFIEHYKPENLLIELKKPELFGDNYSDQLDANDLIKIKNYFSQKEKINNHFKFLNFKIGGKDNFIWMNKKSQKGITFSLPRNSLMIAIEYRIFDDLLIGNFMKTTLHNCESLYEEDANFTFNVTKFGDNGMVETNDEIDKYLQIYKKRAGIEYVIDLFEDKSRNFLTRFIATDSMAYQKIKSIYNSLKF